MADENTELARLPSLLQVPSNAAVHDNDQITQINNQAKADLEAGCPAPSLLGSGHLHDDSLSPQLLKLLERFEKLLQSRETGREIDDAGTERAKEDHGHAAAAIWDRVQKKPLDRVSVMTEEEEAANPSLYHKVITAHGDSIAASSLLGWGRTLMGKDLKGVGVTSFLTVTCCSDMQFYEQKQRESISSVPTELLGTAYNNRVYFRLVESRLRSAANHDVAEYRRLVKIMMLALTVNDQIEKGGTIRGATIGDVLSECYRRQTLRQPDATHSESYLDHACLVINAIRPLNVVYELGTNVSVELTLRDRSPDELLGLPLPDALQLLRPTKQPLPAEHAAGLTFRADDLNIDSLYILGRLTVEWTYILEEHLLLTINPGKKVLKICWFPDFPGQTSGSKPSLMYTWHQSFIAPPIRTKEYQRQTIAPELSKTYAILFATGTSKRQRRKKYGRLESPQDARNWAGDFYMNDIEDEDTYLETLAHLNDYQNQDPKYDQILGSVFAKEVLQYSEFPVYEKRLRRLRAYMDSCNPTGLRTLWLDKRNSANYYTFWGVIIFGTLSVFLALFSLVVSIVQTIAAYKALPVPSTTPIA